MNGTRLFLSTLRRTNPDSAVLRVIEQIEAEQDALAEAWDAGHRFTGFEPEYCENPYREWK